MRDFLLRIYTCMKLLPESHPLRAATAVALCMLNEDDRLAAHVGLLPGETLSEEALSSFMESPSDLALAIGAALAMRLQDKGGVVVAPIANEQISMVDLPSLLHLAYSFRLPIVFLMECDAEFPDDLEGQAALGEIERIQADAADAMRLMPALRLAVDKAREGDGPTLIECVSASSDDETETPDPLARLADVLLTEGYAASEELL